MLDSIFIVVGESGSCSDWYTWDVAAYTERGQAEMHCRACNEEVERLREIDFMDYDPDNPLHRNIFDTRQDSYGTLEDMKYTVEEVKLFVHFDQFKESVGG